MEGESKIENCKRKLESGNGRERGGEMDAIRFFLKAVWHCPEDSSKFLYLLASTTIKKPEKNLVAASQPIFSATKCKHIF
jgi:hypothetical protein